MRPGGACFLVLHPLPTSLAVVTVLTPFICPSAMRNHTLPRTAAHSYPLRLRGRIPYSEGTKHRDEPGKRKDGRQGAEGGGGIERGANLSAPLKRKELRLATKLRILLAKGPSSSKSMGSRTPWPGGKKMVLQQVSDMTANMSDVNMDL